MDLNENINRIQELMLVEDKKTIQVTNMVKDLGLYQTIKFLGGYDRFKRLLGDTKLPKNDVVNFIKEVVMMWMEVSRQPGISILEVNDGPIDCGSDEEFTRQTQLLTKDAVFVDVYDNKPLGMMEDSFMVPYEELPEDTLDKVFETTVKFMLLYNMPER
jgi:hypothetical protein